MELLQQQQHEHSSRTERFLRRLVGQVIARPLMALGLIALLTFTLDGARLFVHPLSSESGETASWWPVVDSVEDGKGYTACLRIYFPFCGPTNRVTAMREPVPVLLFAGVSRLSGDRFNTAALLELVLNLAIVWGIFLLANELIGARTGLLAALLWSIYLSPIKDAVAEVSGDLLATACVTWGTYLFLRARRSRRARDWLVSGICLGLGALSRSALSAIPVVLGLGLLVPLLAPSHDRARRVRAHLRALVLFGFAWGLTLCPWIIRNEIALGQPVAGTTLTGYNLYRENYQLASSNYLRFVSGPEADRVIATLVTRRTDLTGTENEAQMDGVYRSEALRVIKAEPLRYATLSLYRFVMLWFNWPVPQAYDVAWTWVDTTIMAQQVVLVTFAVLGLCTAWRRTWPLWSSVIAVMLLYMAVIARLYLLVPVMPLVMVLSIAGCISMIQRWCAPVKSV